MDEILPVVLAFALGIVIWRRTNGRIRLILSGCAVAISGLAATVLSGEFHQSWVFLLLDLGEAAFGLAIGFLAAHRLFRPGTLRGQRAATSAWPRYGRPQRNPRRDGVAPQSRSHTGRTGATPRER